jgi:predicted nuclease of predicted toxin-antitoxin system
VSGGLFIKLYLDEDVSVILAHVLRSRGYSMLTTAETRNLGASDVEQLEFASTNGLAILTHNRRDFDALAVQWSTSGRSHAGILMATRHPVGELARRMLRILDDTTGDELRNLVLYL